MRGIQTLLKEALEATLKESTLLSNTVQKQSNGKLDIKRLKEFAFKSLPEDSKLRTIILSEKDEVSVEEFLAKIGIWLKLLALESS